MANRQKKVDDKKGKGKGKPGAKGYKLPDPLPQGTVLTDLYKKKWTVGPSIGVGGFGEIYLASKEGTSSDIHVVKVEDHSNGPLFTEIHCLQNVGDPEDISDWMKRKKLKFLGMPKFIGIGSFENGNRKYRFMVMDRYGTDLSKFLKEHKTFSLKCAYTIGIQVIDVLEYLHSQGYVHNDVKAANLLLGYGKGKENQVYLVDFGLASKYMKDDEHKPHGLNARRAHDGTIEYTSRDAHSGAPFSRRADLEILGYNMLKWLCGSLPWEGNLSDPVYVSQQKTKYMDDIPALLKACFPTGKYPEGIAEFLGHVAQLHFVDTPDYDLCRNVLKLAVKRSGHKVDGNLVFSEKSPPLKRSSDENVCASPNKVLRGRKAAKLPTSGPTSSADQPRKRPLQENSSPDKPLSNPTPAMLLVQQRKQAQIAQKQKSPKKKKVVERNKTA